MRRPSLSFYVLCGLFLYVFHVDLYSIAMAVGLAIVGSILVRFGCEFFLQVAPPSNAAVLITGTSTGFGKVFTRRLAKKNLLVFACVRKMEDGNRLREDVPSNLRELIHPVIMDVTNSQQIASALQQVQQVLEMENRKLFAVINNAGIQMPDPLETLPQEKLREIFDVNVFGTHRVCQAFLPLLRANPGSRLINISSLAGLVSLKFMSAYCASKFAVEAMSDGYRVELKPFGVHVSIIEPGSFVTELFSKNFEETAERGDKGPYQSHWNSWLKTVRKSSKMFPSAEWVGGQLERVLFAKFPPSRAAIGPELPSLPLVHFLPDSVVDFVLEYT